MDTLIYIFGAVVLLAAVLASISIWSPRKVSLKVCAIGVTAALMAVAYLGFTDLLSKPKPVDMEWAMRSMPEAHVLGSATQEGEAIFVWLQLDDITEPRAYRIPWDSELAKQLQEATRASESSGTGVKIRRPFKLHAKRDSDSPVFYSPSRRPPPVKARPHGKPMIFPRSG